MWLLTRVFPLLEAGTRRETCLPPTISRGRQIRSAGVHVYAKAESSNRAEAFRDVVRPRRGSERSLTDPGWSVGPSPFPKRDGTAAAGGRGGDVSPPQPESGALRVGEERRTTTARRGRAGRRAAQTGRCGVRWGGGDLARDSGRLGVCYRA